MMDHDEPQNPKPPTEVKKTVGHSYSTRSKVKRTSDSDDESSGAQAQQPPLKIKMRLGVKQAGKSVKIKNNDPTLDSNSDVPNTVDEYAPAKVALQNDLVLESLLRYMNRSDLLSCRIVNKQWQSEATKELRRRKLVIRFYFLAKGNQLRRNTGIETICRRVSECRTPLLLSSFQLKTDSHIYRESAGPTSIFTTVGHHLKSMTLHLNFGNWSRKKCSPLRNSLMADLRNLLFHEASNLEFLEISFDFPFHWKVELSALDSSDPHTNDNKSLLLPKLATFIVSGTPPPIFFADVINAAVNLRYFGGASLACIKYLMEPEGRVKINLFKILRFKLWTYQCNELDTVLMESFLTEHKQNIKLETFECVFEFYVGLPCFTSRIISVINQILECSSESLQKVKIERMPRFEEQLIIPRLPKLKEICFDCVSSRRGGIGGDGFFTQGFNMNTSFPNISSIVVLGYSAHLFCQFFSRIKIELAEPVPRIQYIVFIDSDSENKYNLYSIWLPTVTDFRHIFPNLVSISYVDSDKYYKI